MQIVDNPIPQTPMLKQWLEAKKKSPHALVLFRMGDFYELFGEDAQIAAPILDLTLTSRDKSKEDALPMAGFPYLAAPSYIAKLVKEGHKVAICEQIEDPKTAKGLVRREVVRTITPGVNLEEESMLVAHNYLVGLFQFAKQPYMGLAAMDVSTGDFFTTISADPQVIRDTILAYEPSEILLGSGDFDFIQKTSDVCRIEKYPMGHLKANFSPDPILLENNHLSAFQACVGLLDYVTQTQGVAFSHIRPPHFYNLNDYLIVDSVSKKHLHIVSEKTVKNRKETLFGILNKTNTAFGSRYLNHLLMYPSMDLDIISERHCLIEASLFSRSLSEQMQVLLKSMADMERLCARVSSQRATPKDVGQLRNTLGYMHELKMLLLDCGDPFWQNWGHTLMEVLPLYNHLNKALVEQPPFLVKDGGVFKAGYDASLDEYRQMAHHGVEAIAQIEQREREKTGISSLKIGYTRVFGYYIEVTKANLSKIPEHYKRKQTIAGGERFLTEELLHLEERIQHAKEEVLKFEQRLFTELNQVILENIQDILKTIQKIAHLDAMLALAQVAFENQYVKPKLLPIKERALTLKESRHPILDVLFREKGMRFVPNDIHLDTKNQRWMLLTGPNMAGKSTLMRQMALIQIMAQIGSFVPAKEATLSLCDRIFTRVGATDDLMSGCSTFMMEMRETAHILYHASPHSLVVLDEIGRGTSTYDGLSLAFAVLKDLHDRVLCRGIFATHYHELAELSQSLKHTQNYHVYIEESLKGIEFSYLLKPGAIGKSYGLHVAQLAGLPSPVLDTAHRILSTLEKKAKKTTQVKLNFPISSHHQLGLF